MVGEKALGAAAFWLKPHQGMNDCGENLIKQFGIAKPLAGILFKVRNPAIIGLHEPIRTGRLNHGTKQLYDSSVGLTSIEIDDLVLIDETASKPMFKLLAKTALAGFRGAGKPRSRVRLKPRREHGRSTGAAAVFPLRLRASLS